MDKRTIILGQVDIRSFSRGQKDQRYFDLGETRVVEIPPETESVIITPTTESQQIFPSKNKYIKEVNVEAVTAGIDTNIQNYNIRTGVTILGVQGNLEPDKPDQTKTTTPTEERQYVRPDLGYELSENIVEPIPSDYVGSEVPRKTEETYTPTTTDQEINSGQYLLGKQIIKGDENLASENIAKGKIIFGIEGTHEGGKQPLLQDKEVTPTKETQVVTADEGYDGLNSTTVNPIPEEYIIPEGELEITENNSYDVTNKKTVVVNVPNSGGGSGEYETLYEMKLIDLYQNKTNGWVMPTEEEYLEQEPQVSELITILSGGTI